MTEHASDIIPMLWWLIVTIGGALLLLMVYIGRRWDNKIDAMPEQISKSVAKVHDDIIGQMAIMNETHTRLERDMRAQGTDIDRRVTRLESYCEFQHSRGLKQ